MCRWLRWKVNSVNDISIGNIYIYTFIQIFSITPEGHWIIRCINFMSIIKCKWSRCMHARKVKHLTISGKIIIIGSAASDRSIHCTTTWSVCHFSLFSWTGRGRYETEIWSVYLMSIAWLTVAEFTRKVQQLRTIKHEDDDDPDQLQLGRTLLLASVRDLEIKLETSFLLVFTSK